LTNNQLRGVFGYFNPKTILHRQEISREYSSAGIPLLPKEGFMIGKFFMNFIPGDSWLISGTAMIFIGGLLATGVSAAELPRESVLPLALATKAAGAAVAQCTKDGYRVSAAVVDRAGVVRALLREDGAGPHTVDSSRKKAYTAASMKRPTGELAELVTKMPAIEGIRDMSDSILILGGGLPIEIGGELVGGIGVGGAPGAHLDVACAQAGLESIGAGKIGSAGK
jgi:uncharacterized protein GlcG (DUF336 family)